MALTKNQKTEIVAKVAKELTDVKMAVMCEYTGLSVLDMQDLRAKARETGSKVMVVKNRLLRVAASQNEALKGIDLTPYSGQLLYIFNASDEVAPAKVAADFAKTHPQLIIKGAFGADANVMGEVDAKSLAALPTKQQLRGQLAGLLLAPLSGFANVLNGNLRGVLNVLSAKAEKAE